MKWFGFVILLLAACAPVTGPRGLTNDLPAIQADNFLTRDGLRLPLRHWDAENPKAVIVALHGMGDYSAAFELPAPWWAQHGITTYAYDQRGFGRAPDPGVWGGGDAMRADLDDFVDAARAKHPGAPVFVLGESMGGAVVLSALERTPPHADGIILVAPAVWSRDDMPASYRAALWLAAHTVPWLKLSGEGMNIWPSDNVPLLYKMHDDPIFQHRARTDQVYGLVNLMDEARHAPEQFADPPPILFLYGARDQIIPAQPTEAVIKALGPRAEVHSYDKGYHMLLRDLEGEKIWKEITDWVTR